jgi:hypothetical protein
VLGFTEFFDKVYVLSAHPEQGNIVGRKYIHFVKKFCEPQHRGLIQEVRVK